MSCRLFGLVSFAATTLLAGNVQAACSLSLGWEPFEPFQLKTEAGVVGGIDVDLFTEAAKRAGCTVTPNEIPWERLLNDIKDGKIDAALGATVTDERKVYANFTSPYRKDEFVLFVRKGELGKVGADGLASLVGKPFKLGTVKGYEMGDTFDKLKSELGKQIDETSSTELNLKKLAANRIDGFIENRYVGLAEAKKAGLADKIEIHPVPISSDDVSFMFSKKSTTGETLAAVEDALKAMRTDGQYDKILAKYLK
jgi:polar amino acid transport system substrate-binding protein